MPRRNQGPKLQFRDSRGAYYICWTEGGRSRKRSTGTSDRELAETRLAEFLGGRRRQGGPRDPSQVLITDALVDYATARADAVAAPERIGYALPPLAGYWEGRTIADVTPETCRAYVRWRQRSNGTARRELGILRTAINHAHREGRITRVVPVELPESSESRDRWLTRHEAARLMWAALRSHRARLHLPLFILLALYLGKRKEAILSLRWPQVDLDAGLIDFNPPGRARTKKRRPKNRIPPRLVPHLRRARLRGSDTGHVINVNGHGVRDIKKAFAGACQRADLDDVTPHTLRHTCATWLMQKGIDKWEVGGYLGMTIETLERVYGHHHPDYQRNAAEAF